MIKETNNQQSHLSSGSSLLASCHNSSVYLQLSCQAVLNTPEAVQENRHVKVGDKPTRPQVHHFKKRILVKTTKPWTNIRFPFDIRPSNHIHKEKEPVYHLTTGPFTVTHMSLFGQQPAPGYQSAVRTLPRLNLPYGTIGGPLAHFSSLDVSRQCAEVRNSIRTLKTTFNAARDVTTKVLCVEGPEQKCHHCSASRLFCKSYTSLLSVVPPHWYQRPGLLKNRHICTVIKDAWNYLWPTLWM